MQQLKSANFGKSKLNATGSSGVGYTLIDRYGEIIAARRTNGVYQVAPGIYSVYTSIPDNFVGQILWDTGSYFSEVHYASEEINVSPAQDAISSLSTDVAYIRAMTAGRWKIINNQMIFFNEDNITEIARFDLKDEEGNPSSEAVFERIKV